MDATEALSLLSRWAIDDRREVNAAIARSWADRFWNVPAYLVRDAAEHVLDTGAYIDQQAVKRELTRMRPRIEADVRSAKARRLIPDDWPRDKPLTPAIEQELRTVQATEWEATNDRPEELASPGPTPQLGRIGRPAEPTPAPRPAAPGGRWIPRRQRAALDPERQAAARRELADLPHDTDTGGAA